MKYKKFIISIAAIAILTLSATMAVKVNAASGASREYHLKAAFLRYVAKFVTWPDDAIPESAINICVLGDVPSLKGLNSINGKIVQDRSIVIRTIPNLETAEGNCQMLFVAKSEEGELKNIIEYTQEKPILAFGDMEGFAEDGGDMNFYIVNNRMAIMINQESVALSKLTIAPRMLKLVTIIPDVA